MGWRGGLDRRSLSCTVETVQFNGVILHGSGWRRFHRILAKFRTVLGSIPLEPICCYSVLRSRRPGKKIQVRRAAGRGAATEKNWQRDLGFFPFKFRNFDGKLTVNCMELIRIRESSIEIPKSEEKKCPNPGANFF